MCAQGKNARPPNRRPFLDCVMSQSELTTVYFIWRVNLNICTKGRMQVCYTHAFFAWKSKWTHTIFNSRFLVEFGCDVNAPDSDGWTPLHCAASCNNLPMVRFLVEHGACIFATTLSDHETAAEKCEEDEEGFDGCSEYLYGVQVRNKTG